MVPDPLVRGWPSGAATRRTLYPPGRYQGRL